VTRLQKDRALPQLQDVLRHERLDPAVCKPIDGLPASFVAMSIAPTVALPQSDDNRRFLTALLTQIAVEDEVVIIDCPLPSEFTIQGLSRVHLLQTFAGDGDAAQIPVLQTCALAQAAVFVGSYGDLAILASFCGTPTLTYHSQKLPVDQLDRVRAAAAAAGWGAPIIERAHRLHELRLPTKAGGIRRPTKLVKAGEIN
jgi:hypothetical protein